MSKQAGHPDRSSLPPGWRWADWSGRAEAEQFWANANEKIRQGFRHRFMEIIAASNCGKRLPHDKAFFIRGIGKAKIQKPNPGWRPWCFQDGHEYCITHITIKADDHNKQIKVAREAREEHLAAKMRKAGNETKRTKRTT